MTQPRYSGQAPVTAAPAPIQEAPAPQQPIHQEPLPSGQPVIVERPAPIEPTVIEQPASTLQVQQPVQPTQSPRVDHDGAVDDEDE
jgi:hypothetical protein